MSFNLYGTILFFCFAGANSLKQVEIASPGQLYPSIAGALAFSGPAYEAGVEDANRRYRGIFNFSLTFLPSDYGMRDCNFMKDISSQYVANWYYKQRSYPNGLSAILTPGCLDVSSIHQLVGHWNILYFSTVGQEKSTYVLPAPLIIGSSYIGLPFLGLAVVKLLLKYHWTDVYMIVDDDSPPMSRSIALELTKLQSRSSSFNIFSRSIASKKVKSFDWLLDDFRNRSRVMIFLAHGTQVRRFLIQASSHNLTNGEFVYICLEPSPYKLYGNLSWRYNDAQDEVAREAFRSLLIIHPNYTTKANTAQAAELATGLRQRAQKNWNLSYTADEQPLREVLTGFSTVTMFAQVLNETLDANGELPDARQISQRFLNRTFQDQYTNIYIDENGLRRLTLAVSQAVGNEPSYRQAVLVESKVQNFEFFAVHNISTTWHGAKWPPLNEPLCGFRKEQIQCSQSGSLIELLVPLVLTCLLAIPSAFFWTRQAMVSIQRQSVWWHLDANYYSPAHATASKTTMCSYAVEILRTRLSTYYVQRYWDESTLFRNYK